MEERVEEREEGEEEERQEVDYHAVLNHVADLLNKRQKNTSDSTLTPELPLSQVRDGPGNPQKTECPPERGLLPLGIDGSPISCSSRVCHAP